MGLGLAGAFVAGLLGVGGALVMVPLLLYGPPLLGFDALDMKTVAAITMLQVFAAAASGMLAHRRYKAVDAELSLVGGAAMASGSFVGAVVSKFVQEQWLLLVFAVMVTAAAPLILLPQELIDRPTVVEPHRFSRPRTAVVAGAVGLAAGFVGAGGAFLLVPLLIAVVGVPLRTTIGSSLAITAFGATAGAIGKIVTLQVPFALALAVAAGAVPGAQLGAAVSRRLPVGHLKLVFFAVTVLTAVRVWWHVLVE